MPLVTIALPVYNGVKYLPESIISIKRQTFQDWEVIAYLDGCSDDDASLKVLKELGDNRFRILVCKQNKGIVAATNHILKTSMSPLIALQDQDDVMCPDRLLKQVTYLRSHPDVHIVGTWFDYIDSTGAHIGDPFRLPTEHADIVDLMRELTAIGGPTAMYRRQAILDIGGYDPRYQSAQDLALWLACIKAGCKFGAIPEVLEHYRMHAQQVSTDKAAVQKDCTANAYKEYGPQIWADWVKGDSNDRESNPVIQSVHEPHGG
jgi:alpha-1,6-rhamnosyltransferase